MPLIAVLAAVLNALVAIQIKQLTRVDSPDTVVFYTYVFWVPLSLIPALFVWVWPSGIAWLWLVATGVMGTLGQLLWTRALKLGEVSALTPISFTQLPLVVVMGWLLFGETLDRWTVIGALIILGANAYIAHREARYWHVGKTSCRTPGPATPRPDLSPAVVSAAAASPARARRPRSAHRPITITSPAIAPSLSPSSRMATPMPCAPMPNSAPRAIALRTGSSLSSTCPHSEPQTPVMITTLRASRGCRQYARRRPSRTVW